MKLKTVLISFLFVGVTTFVGAQADALNIQDKLIQELLATEHSKTNSTAKIVIVETKFCVSFDCNTYFQKYQTRINIYTKEEAFMRSIRNYLEIERIDEKAKEMVYSRVNGGKSVLIVISL